VVWLEGERPPEGSSAPVQGGDLDTICRKERQDLAALIKTHKNEPGLRKSGARWPFFQSFGASYCSTGYDAPVQTAAPPVTGVAPEAPLLKWITPSSDEQKLRTPVWLNAAGAAPTP
jgi:hypothetical protein